MDKKKIMKYGSIGCIVIGCIGAYASGVTDSAVTGIVSGVFALAAIIKTVLD